MEKFVKVSGIAAPMDRINIDTDMIIPKLHLRTIKRTGLGKVRHMAVQYMWVQQMVREKWIIVRKIEGTENPADILTKPKNRMEMAVTLKKVGVFLKMSYQKENGTSQA